MRNNDAVANKPIYALLLISFVGMGSVVWARGNGIKAGSGRIHPAIDLQMVFDSNPSYMTADPAADLVLKIRPGISLKFPMQFVELELAGKFGYDYFLGIQNSKTTDLSSIAGEANLQVAFNPKGQFSLYLIDVLSRTSDPRYTSLTGRFDRTDNEAKALLQFKPGGGALIFDLAYGYFIDWYDESTDFTTQTSGDAYSNYAHRIYFSTKWKFLPKTALIINFDADLHRFPNAFNDSITTPDTNGIRATVGLIGQISPTLSVNVKAGYGDTLISGGNDDYRSAIGQAEVSYQAVTTLLQAGYLRGFNPVVGYAYYGQDRIYAHARQQLWGRLSLSADAGFDILNYGTNAADSTERNDYLLTVGAMVEYHILDWLSMNLNYHFERLFSDYQQPSDGTPVDYTRHAIGLSVGIDY